MRSGVLQQCLFLTRLEAPLSRMFGSHVELHDGHAAALERALFQDAFGDRTVEQVSQPGQQAIAANRAVRKPRFPDCLDVCPSDHVNRLCFQVDRGFVRRRDLNAPRSTKMVVSLLGGSRAQVSIAPARAAVWSAELPDIRLEIPIGDVAEGQPPVGLRSRRVRVTERAAADLASPRLSGVASCGTRRRTQARVWAGMFVRACRRPRQIDSRRPRHRRPDTLAHQLTPGRVPKRS